MRFVDAKDPSKSYFSGKGYFSPTDSVTEYIFEATKDGPTERQKQFYRDLQTNFSQNIEKIKPLVEDEFRNWKEDFSIKDFNKEFTLICITIPRFDKQPLTWDMAFTTTHDDDHQVIIDFVGDQPNGILIDG